jgi:BlaI family penicillinase repressor
VSPNFTERELDLMSVLWARGPSTVGEVRERLADSLAYNTVQTILHILEEKGYVGHKEDGRAHRFHACVKREVAGVTATSRVIDKIFGGSVMSFLTNLVNERTIDPDELRRLRRLLDDKIREADQ